MIFNDGTVLEVSSNDIVVFVGANNSGKSQSLKDINKAFINPALNVVVKQIEFEIEGADKFEKSIKKLSSFNKNNSYYSGYGFSIYSGWIGNLTPNSFGMEQLVSFFVKQLDTRDRLNQCDPVGVIDRDEPKTHPLHYLANSPELRKRIDTVLKQHHIYLVPNGELEGFVNVGGHGPGWVTNVIETYPDYGNAVFDDARAFVGTWGV